MSGTFKRATLRCAAMVATMALCATASAQAYPAKPVRMILTYSGGIDAITRLITQRMSEWSGQPILIENQAGAGGGIGATTVARAAPDGYTLLSTTGSTQIQRGFMVKNVPYDPVRDFTPITLAWETMIVLGSNAATPGSSLRDVLEYARANPGKISWGTSGLGTSHHLAFEMVTLLTGLNMVHVPYKGGDQVITDNLAGRIHVASTPLFSLAPHVKSGKAHYLAVMNDKRFPGAPDVPTIRESVPGFVSPPLWSGFFGPAGLPRPIVDRLHADFVKAFNLPEVRARLEAGGLLYVGSTPEELASAVKRDIATVADIVKRAKIDPE
jgi:tripartite-type tricarboxylate transporter receptor subunit TctC